MPKSHTHMHQHLQMPYSRVDLHTLAHQLALKQVTIIGNASGNWQPATAGTTFIFNGTQWHEKSTQNNLIVNIANGGFAESKYAFVVQGHPQSDLLTQALTQVAIELTPKLGCWPSSGLTTIMLMQQLSQHVQVQVQRMSLFPSLARPNDLPPEDHLPCMVHNWLGERRIAQTLAPTLDWPEFTLPAVCLANLAAVNKARGSQTSMMMKTGNPFDLLARLQESTPSADMPHSAKNIQLDWLITLAHTPIDVWLKYADLKQVINAEALFFNHMPESKPSYWYLMDTKASQYLDAIRHSLAYCWQTHSAKTRTDSHLL